MAARETWAKRVEGWKGSGLPAAEFAAKHGLKETSLKWWKWRLASVGAKQSRRGGSGSMSPLTFIEMTTAVRGESLEVVLESGLRVRVAADFDADALGRLLDVLERRR